MDTAALRRGYDTLLAEVDQGGFGVPADGAMTAEQVVAHLVTNDELLTAATEAVIAGSPWAYYDLAAVHRPQLDALVAEVGGLEGLATLLRATSQKLCALTVRLGTAAETPVETHLREGDVLVVDDSLPWGRVLDLHRRVHLPLHVEELRGLRARAG